MERYGIAFMKRHKKQNLLTNLVSYENVKNITTEEIFLNRKPVLTGICLDSGTILFLEASNDCKEETWKGLLERYQLRLEYIKPT